MNERIYFDNAATTRVRPEVYEAMLPFFNESFGNPSGVYGASREGRRAAEAARVSVAGLFNAPPDEIFFTGGGTESDNWAVKGAAYANGGGHIITCATEHHALLRACEYLAGHGFDVTFLPVDGDGLLDPDDVKNAIRPDTFLISVMLANNETGAVQPAREIGKIAKERGVLFHTDAVAAAGHIKTDVGELNADMLSVSAHKLYGPKGAGALYIKNGVKIDPLLHGGSQEKNRRAGTENVAGIAGFGKAAELALAEMEAEGGRETALRDKIINDVLNLIPDSRLNGPVKNRLPGNASFSFKFIEGASAAELLDIKNICVSSGSACSAGSDAPSHVLTAMGLPAELARGSLRVTLGRYNTEAEADVFLRELPLIIKKLRDMSPLI